MSGNTVFAPWLRLRPLVVASRIFVSFVFLHASVAVRAFDLKKDFLLLDSVVANVDCYMEARQKAIDAGARSGPFATGIDRYDYYKHMFDEYKKFSSDSAMAYARLCKQTAAVMGLAAEALLADINLLYISSLRGDIFAAGNIMRRLPPMDSVPPSIRLSAAIAGLEYNMRLVANRSDNPVKSLIGKDSTGDRADIWERYRRYLPADSWLADYYEGMLTDKDMRRRVLGRIDSLPRPSIAAAMLYYVAVKGAVMYGTKEEACHYLILSAVNDIMSANRESSALMMLLNTDYVDNNSDRAVDYAVACVKMADGYNDMARSFRIVKASSIIFSDYIEMQHRNSRNVAVIITLLVLLVGTAAVLVCVLVRRSRRKGDELEMAMGYNSRLRASLDEITVTKERMNDVLTSRNAMLLDSFVMLSDHINEVDKFCKTSANMIVAGQQGKARKVLQEGCSAPFISSLYASFDKWFLSVHPDFVERLLALLRPEERARFLPTPTGLSPELRIYALVSLGITDSVSIAEFLHYSPQTIYNYRLRVRHCACIPEKDFAATVAAMYGKGTSTPSLPKGG